MPADLDIARRVRAENVPVILAINKTDDKRAAARAGEFHRLGFDPVFEVTAEHGTGVFELLDAIVERLPLGEPAPENRDEETAVAIVGRPNVGKSSLVNRLLREERVMVSETPGTTRDTVDVTLQWHKRRVPHRRHRGHSEAGTRRASGPGGGRQRRAREARDRARGRRGRRGRRRRGRGRSGGRDCRRRRGSGLRHRHRGQQVGPGPRPGPGVGGAVRRLDALPAQVPRVRANHPHLGAHGRANAEAARDGGQGRRRAPAPRADGRTEQDARGRSPRVIRRSVPAVARSASCMAPRRPSIRRGSWSSRTSRPNCTSPTSDSW